MPTLNLSAQPNREGLDQDPFWYKSGVIYELHVRAFCDSDGNGIGDFQGLTSKLDYLKDLGVTALWLLPFYPSPLRDDGYDIADYCDVHPNYGTLADFKVFLREAHQRGLRVITELVLNHTSDQHPWFQRARRAKPGSRWRNFYVWSDTPDKYKDARIIFKDVEISNWTWDHVANAYYWHRFFSHQPDLNYDNPEVFEEMVKVVDFWLDLGVDGLRLDAVPYLYEREGTSCENLPETHAFLKKLRAHVDEKYGDRMLLAEANQWPEDAVAYFGQGKGDECHMAFHFPLMPRLFMAVRMEDRTPIVDILEQTPADSRNRQWALFLRNHDELTLEMVTDEERDYMYRMYAHVHQARLNLGIRRRLAPLLGNDRKRIELLNALLFSLPGTPVLYYGDEIGMGDNIYLGDRNGVRTPDAVEFRQERRVLARQPAGALPADHLRSGIPLRSGERGGATGQSAFAALVDAPPAGLAQEMARAGRGPVRVPPAGEPQDPQLRAPGRAGDVAGRGEPFALCAARRAGPLRVQAEGARRVVWPHRLSDHHREALSAHAGTSRLLLVLPGVQAGAGGIAGGWRWVANLDRCGRMV